MPVTVYGASDDLIEVEGDVREEFGGGSLVGDVLVFSDGTELRVKWTELGWRILPEAPGSSDVTFDQVPDDDGDGWNDRATIHGEITWVRHQDDFDLAEAAYAGYCQATGGRSVATGDVLPEWSALRPEIRDAWVHAAEAVKRSLQ